MSNPSQRITQGLQAHGPAWATTDECAAALLDAAELPEQQRAALEVLDAYGRRQEAQGAARALARTRAAQTLHDLPQALERWAADHPDRFAPGTGGEPWGGWWGLWDERRGVLWLRTDVWGDICAAWGLGPLVAIRELRRRGLLLAHRQAGGRRLAARKRLGTRLVSAYPVRVRRIEPDAHHATGTDHANAAPASRPTITAWPGAILAKVTFAIEVH